MTMPANILAGQLIDLQWDEAAKEFKPVAPECTGPVFTVRTLDYFEAQEVLVIEDAKAKMRKGIELMLVSIDGDPEKAATFKAAPRARYTAGLYLAAWGETWGN